MTKIMLCCILLSVLFLPYTVYLFYINGIYILSHIYCSIILIGAAEELKYMNLSRRNNLEKYLHVSSCIPINVTECPEYGSEYNSKYLLYNGLPEKGKKPFLDKVFNYITQESDRTMLINVIYDLYDDNILPFDDEFMLLEKIIMLKPRKHYYL